jgi:hypothetical protein
MITDTQWKKIAMKVMAIPGMKTDHNSDFIVEDVYPGYSYIKFMSDHGVTDDHNGILLSCYLRLNSGVVEQTRPRSMVVRDEDMKRLFL